MKLQESVKRLVYQYTTGDVTLRSIDTTATITTNKTITTKVAKVVLTITLATMSLSKRGKRNTPSCLSLVHAMRSISPCANVHGIFLQGTRVS